MYGNSVHPEGQQCFQNITISFIFCRNKLPHVKTALHVLIQREVGGPDPISEISQKFRVLGNTGKDPLKKPKATKQAFNCGPSTARQPNAIKWCFAGWPMMACLEWYMDPPSPYQLKKELSKFDPL